MKQANHDGFGNVARNRTEWMFENQTNIKKPNIVEGKGGDNDEREKTWGTSVECKTFLNGNGGISKERNDKKREKQSKGKERL